MNRRGDYRQRAGILDRVDLWLLRLAHRRRDRIAPTPASYDGYFAAHDAAKYTGDVRDAWRHSVLRRMFDRCYPDGHALVADIGAGLGVASRFLPSTARVVSVEHSRGTLRAARRLQSTGAPDQVQGAFPALPLPAGGIDFCICTEVIEHLPDDRAALAELARIVRPGGYLLISVPRSHYWPAYLALMGHYRHYSGPELAMQLHEAGFEPVARLSQFPRLWRAYHYAYVGGRGFEALARRLGARSFSLYATPLYRGFRERLLTWLAPRLRDDDPASTYVLARRVERPA